MTKVFECFNCGKTPEHVEVDGYNFGDRLLEDVMFIIKNVKGKPKCTGVTESCKSYFSELNQKMWKKEAEEYALTLDVENCPLCENGDIKMWGYGDEDESSGFEVTVDSGKELVNKMKSDK